MFVCMFAHKLCLKISVMLVLMAASLSPEVRFRFPGGEEGGISAKLQGAVWQVKKRLEQESTGFRKHILRSKELIGSAFGKKPKKLERAENPYSWQVGQGEIANNLPATYTSGKKYSVITEDGVSINAIFHERAGADTLIVVAPGFGDTAAQYAPLLWIFEKASVVFFDFRGHGERLEKLKDKRGFLEKALRLPFSGSETELGQREELEVIAVTQHFKKLIDMENQYKKIVGMGFCFGAAMLVKAQAKYPDLFTHLIMDSLWPRFSKLSKKFYRDPALLMHPRKDPGGFFSRVCNYRFAQKSIKFLAQHLLFKKSLDVELNVCDLLKKVEIPIFLIYGNKDALISTKEFERVWNSIGHSKKVALINNNKHLLTFLKDRELYRITSDSFISQELGLFKDKES